ncbi:hypothetical protein BDD12DRAFT_894788 [Trichophaea hybrida]|nr:hypothetical protein BDD12DRAFT_894788 [Trichophaea hybrida]
MKYGIFDAAAEPKLTYDAPHAEWKTPLIISAQKGLTKATRLLLDLNVDKDAKDNSGRTALHYAVENGSEAVVQLLVQRELIKE